METEKFSGRYPSLYQSASLASALEGRKADRLIRRFKSSLADGEGITKKELNDTIRNQRDYALVAADAILGAVK